MEWRVFEGLSSEDVRAVLALARRRAFKRGEVVFHRGDPADALHLIVKGFFDVQITTRFGDVIALGLRGPGDAFGELALVTDGERTATVTAIEAGETLAVRRSVLEELVRLHASLNDALVRILAEQVARLSELLVEAYTLDAETRLARRLLELAQLFGPELPAVVPLTQEDLAGLAGASRATVNRALRALEREGAVGLGRGRTTLVDAVALERRARLRVGRLAQPV